MMCQVLEQEQARAPHPALRRHLQHRGLVRPLPGDDQEDYNDDDDDDWLVVCLLLDEQEHEQEVLC